MSSKGYFSYVRVSTQRQGNLGTSLAEQLAAIERYAQRFNLRITKHYEERETAARIGRPVFLDLIRALKRRKADGLIIHKIDRSARNLKDWAELLSLVDEGIEVHFANESLDMTSRGGRLSADLQAVVAADYIRNLREETKKGIYGRLRQGLYPFPARVGYVDKGKGNPKMPDPVQAPLIKQAFESYASGHYGLNALVEKMFELGLRNKNGKKISRNGLVCILKNPFYMGLIKIDTLNEMFVGVHAPIITKALFDDVQSVFAGKRVAKQIKYFFPYRKLVRCGGCKNFLIAELQKGYVYYRCQTKQCEQKTIRQDLIESQLNAVFQGLQLTPEEFELLKTEALNLRHSEPQRLRDQTKQLQMELMQIESRLAKLADAYIDGVFAKETYSAKQNELIFKQKEVNEKMASLKLGTDRSADEFGRFLERLKSVYLSYKSGKPEERREMVQITFSNCEVIGKSLTIKLKKPFQDVLDRNTFPVGSPTLATARTFREKSLKIFKKLFEYFKDQSISKDATGEDSDPSANW